MLKTMPIANNERMIQDAPANLFFGCQLKAHPPIRRYKQNTGNFEEAATPEVPPNTVKDKMSGSSWTIISSGCQEKY